MSSAWISVIGIGEDGAAGLTPAAAAILSEAEILIGGKRHLSFFPNHTAEKHSWTVPFQESEQLIALFEGKHVVVLASGDPLWQGVGAALIRWFGRQAVQVVPAPSSYSLAAARLGWALEEATTLTVHGRPLARLIRSLSPRARLLVLSHDKHSPAELAALLQETGYGASNMWVLERLGGPEERIVPGRAAEWSMDPGHDLNLIAVDCARDGTVPLMSSVPGLPDESYDHDGMLTKQQVRAVTLSALQPVAGQMLWDVGAGSGSIAIEWIRAGGQAIAIESHVERVARIRANAAKLGTPELEIVEGRAPEVLSDLQVPDAIFVGGGVTAPDLLALCRDRLKPEGRLVLNTVTVEGEQALFRFQDEFGGTLSRLSVSRVTPRGGFRGWSSLAPVTQLVWTKI